jgi:hypothetical protein
MAEFSRVEVHLFTGKDGKGITGKGNGKNKSIGLVE